MDDPLQRAMITNLTPGAAVVFADGVRVRVVRANISEVRVKSEPVKEPQAANKP